VHVSQGASMQALPFEGIAGIDNGAKNISLERSANGTIGILFYRPGNAPSGPFCVKELLVGGPAYLCGQIRPGDLIQQVDALDVQGLSVDDMSKLLCGPPHSQLTLVVARAPVMFTDMHATALETHVPAVDVSDDATQSGMRLEHVTRDYSGALGIWFSRPRGVNTGPCEVAGLAPGGAAQKSGALKPGDLIYAVGNQSVSGLSLDEVAQLLRGPPSEPVQLVLGPPITYQSGPYLYSLDDSAPSGVPKQREQEGGVDVSLVVSLDVLQAGQEGTQERFFFERHISEDLAFASGWDQQQSSPVGRVVNLERDAWGLGLSFSVPAKPVFPIPPFAFQMPPFGNSPPPSIQNSLASVTIDTVAADSPADLNGIKTGERIYEVDDKPIFASTDPEEIAAMLRGASGTVVRLRVGPGDNSSKGLPPECFVVKNLATLGSDGEPFVPCVHVVATVLPHAARPPSGLANQSQNRPLPSFVAADLAAQARDPTSRLHTGSLTRHLQIFTVKERVNNVVTFTTGMSQASAKPVSAPFASTARDPLGGKTFPRTNLVSVVRSDAGSVGLSFTRKHGEEKGPFYVYDVKENGPAHKTGQINVGEAIHEIDGREVHDLGLESAIALMRGPPASKVTIMLHNDLDGKRIVDEVKRASNVIHVCDAFQQNGIHEYSAPRDTIEKGSQGHRVQSGFLANTGLDHSGSVSVYGWKPWGSPADSSSAAPFHVAGVSMSPFK
jgi:C-terminal processing protease CtpA/Prc